MIKGVFQADTAELTNLTDRLQKSILKKAARAAARVVITDARQKVPVRYGALKKSLSSKVDSPRGTVKVYAIVGPRSKYTFTVKGKTIHPARYAAMVEYGPYKKPFLRPAWLASSAKATQAFNEVVASEVHKR